MIRNINLKCKLILFLKYISENIKINKQLKLINNLNFYR